MSIENTEIKRNRKALGKHLIAELYDCDRKIINDQDLIEKCMIEAVEVSGATLVKTVFTNSAHMG